MGILALAGLLMEFRGQEQPLRTAVEVLRLPATEARQSRDVRLRGVVTFTWHTGTTEFTIEDATGAVWCPAIALPANCRVGTEVEIEGRTEAGFLGPFVNADTVRAMGARALPSPPRATFEELLTAQLHGRRVEITGIVRGQRVNPELGLDWLALEVATGGGRITVNVTHEATGHPELIDAMVRIRGVNLHGTDAQQQAFLPMLNAHTLADVEVVTPAMGRPFDQPLTPLASLMRSASVAGAGHRLRARGVVTFVGRGDSFYFQDESRGIQVFLRDAPRPDAGEAVDVVGFPEPGAFSPVLRDADWRPTAGKGAPVPLPVSMTEATKHDGRLLTVEGRLTEITKGDREVMLTLELGGRRGRIHILNAAARNWVEGSRLRATGVCSVEIGDWESFVAHRKPTGFSLLTQDPGSITLVQSAPWWNLRRVVWLLAVAAVSSLGALGLAWWRTKVRLRETSRTREAAHAQFVAVIAERNRIAREIHDTLAQGFAGISVQLEVLNDRLHDAPTTLRRHLDLARDLVRSSLDEARRSVWNLRAQALEEAGLGEALARLGQQLSEGANVTFELRVDGTPRTLPVDVENNLLRIGQEAITNAVRHASAKRISLSLSYLADRVCLVVSDDGRGFDPKRVRPSARGGFGLSGIRERAETMHASLTINPESEGGTRLELGVPHV
jgi:signal transduction histidine kinase